jgi:restriction system protein
MNPTYNEYFLPILKSIVERQEIEIQRNTIYELMIKYFSLSDEEIRQTIPSGTQLLYQNRIGWALTYLTKAGLIIRIRKGVYKISSEGSRIVSSKKTVLTLDDLKTYKTFVEFISPTNQLSYKTIENLSMDQIELNPEELLEKTFEKNKEIIKKEIISRILEKPPIFFEKLVLDVLKKLNYGNQYIPTITHTGKSGDQGIDGIIKSNFLGFDSIYVQAKRWTNTITSSGVQSFIGALTKFGATKGVFITTSDYTRDAVEYCEGINSLQIKLINGLELAEIMYVYKIGLTTKTTYDLNTIDSDYFED